MQPNRSALSSIKEVKLCDVFNFLAFANPLYLPTLILPISEIALVVLTGFVLVNYNSSGWSQSEMVPLTQVFPELLFLCRNLLLEKLIKKG